jgi:hypothetical protein
MQKSSLFNADGYMLAALVVIANAAAIAAEALHTEIGSNGPAGFVLFGAGMVGLAYILVGMLRAPGGAILRFARRSRGGISPIVSGWALVTAAALLVVGAAGAKVFKNHSGGVEDLLNTVSFFAFTAVVLFFGTVVVGTALVWATQDASRLAEVEARERWS